MWSLRRIIKKYINKKYSAWDITVALRYLPIVKDINKNYHQGESILEVGSAESGITTYLKRDVTGVDLNFDKNLLSHYLQPIQGYATALPFRSLSFDYALSVDTLEHIPPVKRKQAIKELLRVARKKVYLAFPCGKEAQQADVEIDKYYLRKHKKRFLFLEEHLKYGLPEFGDIKNYLEMFSDFKVSFKKNTNIQLWKLLLSWGLSDENLKSSLYHRSLLFTPVFKYFNFGKTYRVLFIMERKSKC